MKVLITGCGGFLGSYLFKSLKRPDTIGLSRNELDLSNESEVKKKIDIIKPSVIIHTAAITNVDLCEKDIEVARINNVLATRYLLEAVRGSNCQFVYISTDQIFDGKKKFYSELDSPSPLNVYGKTKFEGEVEVSRLSSRYQILRTNFYGLSIDSKPSFLNWCLNILKNQTPASLYVDVFYTPIAITDLTRTIKAMIGSSETGIFNVTGDERVSKADFFKYVARELSAPTDIFGFSPYIHCPGTALRPLEMSLCNKKVKDTFRLSFDNISNSLKTLCS